MEGELGKSDGGQGLWGSGRGGRGYQELGGGGLERGHKAGGEGGPGFLLDSVSLSELEGLSQGDLAGGGALGFDRAPVRVALAVPGGLVTTEEKAHDLPRYRDGRAGDIDRTPSGGEGTPWAGPRPCPAKRHGLRGHPKSHAHGR